MTTTVPTVPTVPHQDRLHLLVAFTTTAESKTNCEKVTPPPQCDLRLLTTRDLRYPSSERGQAPHLWNRGTFGTEAVPTSTPNAKTGTTSAPNAEQGA